MNVRPILTAINKGVREDSDSYIRLCTELGFNTCGTEMHMNSTHVSYLNRLFTTNGNPNGVQKGDVIMGTLNEYIVPWHCVYPLEYLVGLSSGTGDEYGYFIPKIYEVVTVTLLLQPGEGTGEFPVAMMLYEDSAYDQVYNEPPMLNVTDRYVYGCRKKIICRERHVSKNYFEKKNLKMTKKSYLPLNLDN